MDNPWKNINLDDYENHMKLDSVMQLQAMNEIMYDQFYRYQTSSIMILGIAGGNGLNHIKIDKIQKVYGVDINKSYLEICVKRYPSLKHMFFPIHADLQDYNIVLPKAELLVANLLIEYIGYENFKLTVQKVEPDYVSCVIQINTDYGFVSNSPYLHSFDCLNKVHNQISEHELIYAMQNIGYKYIFGDEKALPNGKKLVRLDYQR